MNSYGVMSNAQVRHDARFRKARNCAIRSNGNLKRSSACLAWSDHFSKLLLSPILATAEYDQQLSSALSEYSGHRRSPWIPPPSQNRVTLRSPVKCQQARSMSG